MKQSYPFFSRKMLGLVLFFLGQSLLGGCFNSCESPFEPRTVIEKNRLLAIQSTLPELSPGETTQFKALVVGTNGPLDSKDFLGFPSCFDTQKGIQEPSIFWLMCLPGLGPVKTSDATCASGANLSLQAGTTELPKPSKDSPYQILLPPCGNQVSWTVPKTFLDPLEEGKKRKGGEGVVINVVSKDTKRQISLKSVLVSSLKDNERNKNPELKGIKANGFEVSTCKAEKPTDCFPYKTPANVEVKLEALFSTSSFQTIPEDLRQTKDTKENLSIQWYTTRGSLKNSRTFLDGNNQDAKPEWPTFVPENKDAQPLSEGDSIWIWAVITDFRGGVHWISFQMELIAAVPLEKARD